MRNIPGIRVQAICDIWEHAQKRGKHRVRTRQGNDPPNVYIDLDEMLVNEKDLDAAIITTPDFWHAPHAIQCMEAGLHVYCESMMAHTIDAARSIVRTSEHTGKLCQIGYQHRSSAVYQYIQSRLLSEHRICGDIHNINSQWNITSQALADWRSHRRMNIPEEILRRYGYEDMRGFLNWRHDLARSHGVLAWTTARQMDLIHWLIDAIPSAVNVNASRHIYKNREHFDNLMCVFQYEKPHGTVHAFHQALSSLNDPETPLQKFMGTDATLRIAEFEPIIEIRNRSIIDESSPKLAEFAQRGLIRPTGHEPCYFKQYPLGTAFGILSGPSYAPIPYELPGTSPKPALELHLQNFFEAIHGRTTLNCDARTAFKSEAAIYDLHAAGESGEPHRFTPEQFKI